MAELRRWAVVGLTVLALAACRDPAGVADQLLSKNAPDITDVQDQVDALSSQDAADADAAQVGDVAPDIASDVVPDIAADVPQDAEPDGAPDALPDMSADVALDMFDSAGEIAPDSESDGAADVAPDAASDGVAEDAPETAPDVPAALDADSATADEDAVGAAETADAEEETAAPDAEADAAPDAEPEVAQADLTVVDAQPEDGAPDTPEAADAESPDVTEEIGEDAAAEVDAGPACSVQTCSALGPCWTCDPASGCLTVADQSACTDGDACSSGDHCQGGICLPGAAVSCDDANTCTDDACQMATGCSNTANVSACEDGSKCTLADACSGAVCIAGSVTPCDDDNGCTTDACDPTTGCAHTPNALDCQDGDACTTLDKCAGGACVGSQAVVCTALDACHVVGVCDSKSGVCSNPPATDGNVCSDGLPCTQGDACAAGVCKAGANVCPCTAVDGAITCNDSNVCTADACTSQDGLWSCSHTALAGSSCDDGDACTQSDACVGSTCQGSSPVVCSAIDACHEAGACVPTTGTCTSPARADGSPCDDGDACTQSDGCQKGACEGSNPVNCAASDQCHSAGTCDKSTGNCSNPSKTDGTTCSDANSCTQSDSCQGGVCTGSNPVTCTASNACHSIGTCDAATGNCSNPAKTDGSPCSDGLTCTSEACQAGVCETAAVTCPAHAACAEPGGCACQNGYIGVDVNGNLLCAPDFPAWGNRPEHPDPAWFELVGDGTVKDAQTGLLWQQGSASPGHGWGAAKAYCQDLVLGDGQKSDWRLPTVAELQTLIDFTAPSPVIVSALVPTTVGDSYWTAVPTTTSGQAWNIAFNHGQFGWASISTVFRVRCVSGVTETSVSTRYTPKSGGVILDNLTQLSWQRDGTASGSMTWNKAAAYCANVKLGSPPAGGWRLPTAVELDGLLDRSQQPVTIDQTAFPLVAAVWYWTSTPASGIADQFASAYFGAGQTGVAPAVDAYSALCVRGGCTASGCDDANACTTDTCDASGNCLHTPVAAPPPETCNGIDDDCNGVTDDGVSCDDSNDCTTDSCDGTNGCQHAYISGPCSDGLTCTDESCQNGVCTVTPVECKSNATCLEPAGCTCDPGFVTDWVDGQHRCAIDYPIWGARPVSPPAAWFVDDGDATVTDTQTQLIWQKTPSEPMLHGAAMDYCSDLGVGDLTDWRLPSDAELQSLSDYGVAGKALPAAFPSATGYFWTATPVLPAATSDAAWFVSATNASNSFNGGNTLASVRCVYGDPAPLAGAKWPPQRFVAAADTVLDTATNLTWQRDGTVSGSHSFQSAADYCAGLALAGGGWRVPSITELSSLIDRSVAGPMIDNTAFPKTINNWYWSSTTDANAATNAWTLQFSVGNNYPSPKSDPYGVVRCVKGKGACQLTTQADCSDSNPCTTDACDAAAGGCVHTATCDDNDACTTDVCDALGACTHAAVDCDDKDDCTTDSCAKAGGCVHTDNADGSACGDGLVCTSNACDKGSCVATPVACASNATCGEPGGCVCNAGYLGQYVDGKLYCAPEFPVWGIRPIAPPAGWLVDKANGTLSDTQTNLLWQKTSSSGQTWAAAGAYCDGLSLGGKTDWRLPTLAELRTLAWFDRDTPAAIPVLQTISTGYWTADVAAGDSASAWLLKASDGRGYVGLKTDARASRCVRADAALSVTARFTVDGAAGTIEDAATGLAWEAAPSGWGTHDQAVAHCAGLTTAGGGWRVPTDPEMMSIFDVQETPDAIDKSVFASGSYAWHWTSTVVSGQAGSFWAAGFSSGDAGLPGSDQEFVRCVKGAGACDKVTAADCDDGNGCTTDSCDAGAGGCIHTSAAPGTACGTGQVCNTTGGCIASLPGMVAIPAGTFWMGCNAAKDTNCSMNDKPQHKVTLSAYYMDLTETTVGQYKACVDAGVCTVPASVQPAAGATYPNLAINPVNYVSWTQSQQFCKWRGAGFDLPTEAQWEMAARGSCEKNGSNATDPNCKTEMRVYAWGDAAPDCTRAAYINGGAGCGTGSSWPVGSKTAGDSPYGLHDMGGNVWEWNRDGFAAYPTEAQTDPVQPVTDATHSRRGGGYGNGPEYLPSRYRLNAVASMVNDGQGFRCMRSICTGDAGCDDGNPCTTDTCDASSGICQRALLGPSEPCSDGNACTNNDFCSSGICVSGATDVCDDDNACTTDTCTAGSGACTHTAKCVDGQACTIDMCSAGTCSYPALYFDKTHGGTAYDLGIGLLALQDGFLLTGKSRSYGDGTTEDTYVIRTDRAGTKSWGTNMAASSLYSAVVAGSGFVLGGGTFAKGAGDSDAWIVKLDAQGAILWDQTYGTASAELGSQIIDVGDGYALAGYRMAVATDAWLIRTDADGNKLWDKTYSGGGWDKANGIAKLSDGFALAGAWGGVSPNFIPDGWLIRTNLNGNPLWDVKYGGSGNEEFWGVQALTDGFVLAGTTNSKGAGGVDIWVVRTDLQGQKLWDRTYGGTGDDAGGPLDVLPDGGLALGGYLIGPGGNVAALIRTDSLGNVLWQKTYGTFNSGIVSLKSVGDGFAMNGWTMEFGAGDDDFWLLRADSFGNANCLTSGTCVGKAVDGCDDANACTADQCTASGCQHGNLGEWTPCGAGMVCDGAGTCQDVKTAKGMAYVPAGTFWMGCNAATDGNCSGGEGPQHKVTLSSYYMDLTEVTVAAYKSCVDAGVCTPPSSVQPTQYATYPGLSNNPVNFVDWSQARAYCQWAGGDLPTEAQWEMAARGDCVKNGKTAGDATCAQAMQTYPWGDSNADCSKAVMYDGSATGCGAGLTSSVGSKTAGDSPYGLHDMAGNVWEWNRDWHGSYEASSQTDPTGLGSASDRVMRGGSLSNDAVGLRASLRNSGQPSSSGYYLGFRCARSFGATPTITCANAADGTACNDGNACTTGDACKVGVCVGTVVSCDDSNACTTDSCNATTGCTHSNLPDWTACGTGMICNGNGTCQDVKTAKGMAYVPAGTFWMGCNAVKDANCQADENPQHKVTLSSYYMDVNEVTTTQWKACVDGGGCTAPGGDGMSSYCNWDTAGAKVKSGREQFPANCVDWTQSQAYCKWRGAAFDLPTEAQWEMAARGDCVKNGKPAGDPTCAQAMRTYPWGDTAADCSYAVMNNGSHGCGTNATWAVGSKTAGDSPYGLHDMAGNVWEWNRDWYDSAYYGSSPASDPTGPASGSSRVDRGGSFGDGASSLRGSLHYATPPSYAYVYLGLRCARSYP